MAICKLRFGLASVFASLLLIYASGETIASSREADQGAGLTRLVTASTEPLACDDTPTVCFDLATNDPNNNITDVFVDSGCGASPSDFFITLDGVPAREFHTNGGPCQDFPREVWFPLSPGIVDQGHLNSLLVCVTVVGASSEGIQVYGKAGGECIVGTMP